MQKSSVREHLPSPAQPFPIALQEHLSESSPPVSSSRFNSSSRSSTIRFSSSAFFTNARNSPSISPSSTIVVRSASPARQIVKSASFTSSVRVCRLVDLAALEG
ncbi:hypothetical protein BDM02DRAFT_3122890 [Thelephora ganbajun]|uniref:Uncharacterized protein n=1 Tax=Thelephora ganbajun TaxID=370292 RepID=A0ACB6Z291_THEGA|nr:hypothetical protein BDM02DRAFT_3122890 [Thelephora ganbajun]